jgi:hypothetical protein
VVAQAVTPPAVLVIEAAAPAAITGLSQGDVRPPADLLNPPQT